MIAMLGLTMAGAGMMKSQTAIAKKNAQQVQKAQALADLQVQQTAQAQTAQANWAENQAMQASAKQTVMTQVTQSQANKDFWSAYAVWQQQVARRLEAIRQAQQLAWRNQIRNVLEMRPPRGSEGLLQLYHTGSFSLRQLENAYERGYTRQLRSDYGVILSDNDNPSDNFKWTLPAIYNVFLGTEATAQAFYDYHYGSGLVAPYALAQGQTVTKEEMFRAIMGPIELKLFNKEVNIEVVDPITNEKKKKEIGASTTYPSIEVYQGADHETNKFEFNLVHEYGHFINARALQTGETLLSDGGFSRSRDGMPHPPNTDLTNQVFQQNLDTTVKEEWADMFLYWVYDAFSADEAGIARKEAMSNWMKTVASLNYGPAIGGELVFENLRRLNIITTLVNVDTNSRQGVNVRYGISTSTTALELISVEQNPDSLNYGNSPRNINVIGISESQPGRALVLTGAGNVGWIDTRFIRIDGVEVNLESNPFPSLSDEEILQFTSDILFR